MPASPKDEAKGAGAAPPGPENLSHSEVAERLRALAAEAKSPEARRQLTDLASLFERLAVQAKRFSDTYLLGKPKPD